MGILSATQSPPQRQLALRVMEWRKRSERCCNMHQRRFNSRRMGILTAVQIPLWGVASDDANMPVIVPIAIGWTATGLTRSAKQHGHDTRGFSPANSTPPANTLAQRGASLHKARFYTG